MYLIIRKTKGDTIVARLFRSASKATNAYLAEGEHDGTTELRKLNVEDSPARKAKVDGK